MRIISDFHDYYDSAQQFGQDQSIIYHRKQIEYCVNETPTTKFNNIQKADGVLAELHDKLFQRGDFWFNFNYYSNVLASKKSGTFYYTHGRLVFCGKIYNYLKVTTSSYNENNLVVFYDMDSFATFCDVHEIDLHTNKQKFHKKTPYQKIKSHLEHNYGFDEAFFVENKFICVDFVDNRITVNPCIKDIEFYRVMDPFMCFQEIDSYICGKLSFPQNAMVEIEDKYRIEQHGFDKHSFRKLPTKKR